MEVYGNKKSFHQGQFHRKGKPLNEEMKISENLCLLTKNAYFCRPVGELAQLARAFDWQSKGHRFDSVILHKRLILYCFSLFFMDEFFVYVIVSRKDGRFYFGQTNDLVNRLAHHNAGYSTYTAKFLPWELVAFKQVKSRAEAMKLEKKIKNCKSSLKMEHFITIHRFQKVIGPEK